MQKRRFKVLAALPRTDGQGEWFMRIGNGFENKDASINVYLDAIPVSGNGKGLKLQIRELDENDLRQREANRANASANGSAPRVSTSAPSALDGTPF